MFKNLKKIIFVSITLLIGAPAQAGIFKWVDANGLTHYSDKAPANYQSQTVDMGLTDIAQHPIVVQQKQKPKVAYDLELIGKGSTDNGLLKQEVMYETPLDVMAEEKPDLDALEYDLREAAPKKVEQKSLRHMKEKLCTNARMRFAALTEEGFASYLDEDGNHRLAWGEDIAYQGERLYLTEKQVTKLSKEAKFEVETYCLYPYDQKLQDEARTNWIRSEYCAVSKAYLEDLQRPDMRTSDDEINQQTDEVTRFCSELKPDEHRNDDHYYPVALRAKHIKPKHKYTIHWH